MKTHSALIVPSFIIYIFTSVAAIDFDCLKCQALIDAGSCCHIPGVNDACIQRIHCSTPPSPPTSPTPSTSPPSSPTSICTYHTAFRDDFDLLDDSTWNLSERKNNHNNELQYYRPQNVDVRDGTLVITPREERFGSKEWTSGKVTTKGKRSWKYGRFTVRAKLPSGLGLWPAIWMMPQDSIYGGWAASGEIDIMEGDGSSPSLVSSALHFSDSWPNNRYEGVSLRNPFDHQCPVHAADFSESFHLFQFVWTPTNMVFLVDNVITWEVDLIKNWHYNPNLPSPYSEDGQPWDQRFYLILNVAIGGWFLQNPEPGSGSAWPDPEMIVDYVQVEQRDGDEDGLCADVPTQQSLEPPTCRVKEAVTAARAAPALTWVCGPQDYVEIDCAELFADNSVTDDDVLAQANLAFNQYYENAGRTDTACCFGDSDGTSNCIAELACNPPPHPPSDSPSTAPTTTPTKTPTSPPTSTPTTTPTSTSTPTITPTVSPTSSPTSSPPTTLCPSCKLRNGVTDYAPALNWVCAQTIFPFSCPNLFSSLLSDIENANAAFDKYYKGVVDAQGDRGCCFGNDDGVSNCRTEIIRVPCSNVPPAPTPAPLPSNPEPPPSNPADLVVPVNESISLSSNISPHDFNEIIISGTLTIDSNTHVRAKRVEVEPSGTLLIGPDAVNVIIELLQDDCRSSAPHPDDGAAVRNSDCLRSGQIFSRGTTKIAASPVTSWTTTTVSANVGEHVIEVDACQGWVSGATIVIANGAGQNEAQERVIESVTVNINVDTPSSSSLCSVRLTAPLSQPVRAFDTFLSGLPIPQEVLYMHRHVKITGRMIGEDNAPRDRQGIVVRQHELGSFQMSHTRVENCGRIFIGEYCVHLHLMKSSPSSFITSNAIVNGISKGITIHGTHHATVEDNVVYNVKGVGVYVENGREMKNNFISNVVGCPTLGGCRCNGCVPSQSFGDEARQGAFYFKSANQNFIGNHAFGSFSCYLVDYQDVRTPCTMFLPSGTYADNVFHCLEFGWYPTNAFPRNVVQNDDGLVEDLTSCRAFNSDGTDNGKEVVIDNHTEYDIRAFGAASYEFSDIRFKNSRIQGRTALYQKTYFRSEGTGPFCSNCEIISHPFVGLNLAGGEALMEFRDTILLNGVLSIPHHGYINGGLLASHYWFSGDVSRVNINKIYDENLSDPNAIVVTVGDVNHFMDRSRAAFDHQALGCNSPFNDSPKAMTCPEGSGRFRPLKIYSEGPRSLAVTVKDPTTGQTTSHIYPFYNKKSSFVDVFPQQEGRIVYGGFSFVVREGAEVTIKSLDPVAAVDFGHRGWDTAAHITLNLESPGWGMQSCIIYDDHQRRFMTPYGPLVGFGGQRGVDLEELCTFR